jgi:biopolymer transport protein TolR
MSMDVGGKSGGLNASINVTPLVDVMLVLLIIMMVITPMLQQGISVRLPLATNTVPKPDTQEQTTVAIGSGGEIYVNAKPIRGSELASKLTEILENKKDKLVFIRADQEARYSDVMDAMDQLRTAQIEDVALITSSSSSVGGAK